MKLFIFLPFFLVACVAKPPLPKKPGPSEALLFPVHFQVPVTIDMIDAS